MSQVHIDALLTVVRESLNGVGIDPAAYYDNWINASIVRSEGVYYPRVTQIIESLRGNREHENIRGAVCRAADPVGALAYVIALRNCAHAMPSGDDDPLAEIRRGGEALANRVLVGLQNHLDRTVVQPIESILNVRISRRPVPGPLNRVSRLVSEKMFNLIASRSVGSMTHNRWLALVTRLPESIRELIEYGRDPVPQLLRREETRRAAQRRAQAARDASVRFCIACAVSFPNPGSGTRYCTECQDNGIGAQGMIHCFTCGREYDRAAEASEVNIFRCATCRSRD